MAAPSTPPDSPVRVLHTTEIRTIVGESKERGATSPLKPARILTTQIQHSGSPDFLQPDEFGNLKTGKLQSRVTKLKKTVTFEPRVSPFDRLNPLSGQDAFRGFHTLFWILMGIMTLRAVSNTWHEHGRFMDFTFGKLIGKDGLVLAISDGVLVGSTLLCVPFMQLVERGWLRYRHIGIILQHLAQAAYLGIAVRWTFHRQWFWVQSGFLTLHSLSMMMKIHSYCAMNGAFSEKRRDYLQARRKLKQLLNEEIGGETAAIHQAYAAAVRDSYTSALSTSPMSDTFPVETTLDDSKPLSLPGTLRLRRKSSRSASSTQAVIEATRPLGIPLELPESVILDEDLHILCFHPNSVISDLAIHAADLLDDMTSKGDLRLRYPANLTYRNFLDYLLVPTLVYELEYPRTKSIRLLYVVEKTLATFGTLSLILVITDHYIWPVTQQYDTSFLGMALDLAGPFMINYILIFYIMHSRLNWTLYTRTQKQCNAFAELTHFADRSFYEDWWNAISFDEFARKWNKPVHTFVSFKPFESRLSFKLLRHVYTSTITTYKVSRFQAAFITFFLSACLHELVMAVVTKKIRLYLFAMQMAQLPLIVVGRAKFFKRNPGIGNVFFWIGLLSGFPLLAVGYLRF